MSTNLLLRSDRIPAVALAMFVSLGLPRGAHAEWVSLTAGFGVYSGAVGNGTGIAPDREYQSFMNGNLVAPSEPLPGLESLYIAPDPNDPSSVGQGIGRGVVSLGGGSSVNFYTTVFNTSDGTLTDGIANLVAFTPGPDVNVNAGNEFLLGTFSFENGEWWAASPIHQFTFEIVTHSTDLALDQKVFSDTLVLNITPNGGPPEVRADFFYFAGRPDLGSIRVLELFDGNNFGTVDLYGKIGSLIPTKLANPTGGVFLDPSTDPFPIPPPAVPEPSTLVMLSTLALFVISARRIRRSPNKTRQASISSAFYQQ